MDLGFRTKGNITCNAIRHHLPGSEKIAHMRRIPVHTTVTVSGPLHHPHHNSCCLTCSRLFLPLWRHVWGMLYGINLVLCGC